MSDLLKSMEMALAKDWEGLAAIERERGNEFLAEIYSGNLEGMAEVLKKQAEDYLGIDLDEQRFLEDEDGNLQPMEKLEWRFGLPSKNAAEDVNLANSILNFLCEWQRKLERIRKKHARTKKDVVERIRELREQGKETWEIADIFNEDKVRKQKRKGKSRPWNEADIRRYMRDHNIP